MNNNEKYAEHIKKTGFVLEFQVTKALQAHGWNVITNKYYVDDVQESVREIDLVSYKISYVGKMRIYTALIISCKKSEENAWVLLARKPNHNDPNIDWNPRHVWSNDKAIDYMLSLKDSKQSYQDHLVNNSLSFFADKPKRHIFAFQEMAKESGKPKNDKAIFDSVTSLMKAQTYEMSVLPERRSDTLPSVYQFNLLNVVGTDLLCLDFEGDDIVPDAVLEETYVASYIVNKKHVFSRIHFINPEILDAVLNRYNELHRENVRFFENVSQQFYKDAAADRDKRNVFRVEFLKEATFVAELYTDFEPGWIKEKDIMLSWDEKNERLKIYVSRANQEKIDALNEPEVTKEIRELLVKFYRYSGDFKFFEFSLDF
ncbi:hypothetical protein [Massilia aerilata]|uniref:DUF4365 domain-containing protein n=1 Tax=Massilia aerilata TaxID=453817 RepID=A0ABW0RY48_9BURK